MKSKELILEAESFVNNISSKILDKVMEQAVGYKPEYVSLINKINRICIVLRNLFKNLSNIIDENTDVNSVINIGKNMYIAFNKNSFYFIRSKPFLIVLTYNSFNNEISIKTRDLRFTITNNNISASLKSVKTITEINKIEEYVLNYRELNYIANYLSRIVEKYLAPIIEARVKISK
ncbi:MAG: hypothetical protein QXW87_00925 [Desulfurococcaceae archaeon]